MNYIKLDEDLTYEIAKDAINEFCRDILVKEGHLTQEVWDSEETKRNKTFIVKRISEKWNKSLPRFKE